MDDLTRRDFDRIGEVIQSQEFDHPFILTPNGEVRDAPSSVVTPDVTNDPTGDVEVSQGWTALTGMTGQYAYNGAIMHPSEFIGGGIAERMVDEVRTFGSDGIFAIVEVRDDGTWPDGDPIGWAIAMRDADDEPREG